MVIVNLTRGAPDPEFLDPAGSGSTPDPEMLDPAGSGTRPDPNALDPAGSGSSMILALPYLLKIFTFIGCLPAQSTQKDCFLSMETYLKKSGQGFCQQQPKNFYFCTTIWSIWTDCQCEFLSKASGHLQAVDADNLCMTITTLYCAKVVFRNCSLM